MYPLLDPLKGKYFFDSSWWYCGRILGRVDGSHHLIELFDGGNPEVLKGEQVLVDILEYKNDWKFFDTAEDMLDEIKAKQDEDQKILEGQAIPEPRRGKGNQKIGRL
jgi:hypothetical protein